MPRYYIITILNVTISTKTITAKLVYVYRMDKNYKELSKALTKKKLHFICKKEKF